MAGYPYVAEAGCFSWGEDGIESWNRPPIRKEVSVFGFVPWLIAEIVMIIHVLGEVEIAFGGWWPSVGICPSEAVRRTRFAERLPDSSIVLPIFLKLATVKVVQRVIRVVFRVMPVLPWNQNTSFGL